MTTELKPRQRLIFPLDVPDMNAARGLVKKLHGQVGYFKIGLELFVRRGPEAVREIQALCAGESGIFLDLKLHDIPATVGRAMQAVAALGADLITIHASGGPAMMEAAKKAAGETKVLAVTVLTSIDAARLAECRDEYREPGRLVLHRAREAVDAGCDGFVCSGHEAAILRNEFGPKLLIVTPGIRPAWSLVDGDDQKRVMTPERAIRAGSDLLVVGRPIRDAEDPAAAARNVVSEIEAAIKTEE